MPTGVYKRIVDPWNKGKKTGIIPVNAFKKGMIPWNKGLTEETDDRVKPFSDKRKKHMSRIMQGNKNGEGYRHPEKIKRHLSESKIGINNPMYGKRGKDAGHWKGGISSLEAIIRQLPEYYQWRSDVYRRDNWTCQTCGKKSGGIKIDAHHIKPFAQIIKENKIKTVEQALNCEELWNINNGLTLCKKCHSKIHNCKSRNKRV